MVAAYVDKFGSLFGAGFWGILKIPFLEFDDVSVFIIRIEGQGFHRLELLFRRVLQEQLMKGFFDRLKLVKKLVVVVEVHFHFGLEGLGLVELVFLNKCCIVVTNVGGAASDQE